MKRRRWEPYEDRYVRTLYPHFPTRTIAEGLERTERQVYMRAQVLGLYKHPAYLLTPDAGRFDGEKGRGYRFPKGNQPWNKGVHWDAGGRSADTRFNKGHMPQTWVPIGTERTTKDGILQRKVSDTGVKRKDWRPVHVLKWEKHRGPVPKGYIVIFRNGDKRDFRIRNLKMVSRGENMVRNTLWNRYPPEVAKTIHHLGQFRRRLLEHSEAV